MIEIGDAVVYPHDLDTLNDKSWVGDMIIHAHGILLERKARSENKKVLFIPPCTVQFFRYYPDEIVFDSIPYWNPFDSNIVFIPFSDGTSCQDVGSHWHLLMWLPNGSKDSLNEFVHFDSMFQNCDISLIESVVDRFTYLYQVKKYVLKHATCPQQTNGYDCGVYLMSYEEFLSANEGSIEGLDSVITPIYIQAQRKCIQQHLIDFGKQK